MTVLITVDPLCRREERFQTDESVQSAGEGREARLRVVQRRCPLRPGGAFQVLLSGEFFFFNPSTVPSLNLLPILPIMTVLRPKFCGIVIRSTEL